MVTGGIKYNLWNKTVKLCIPKEVFPTQDEIQEMEAAMPGCQHGWMKSATLEEKEDEYLHYRYVLPPSGHPPKAVVIYMHGIQTHSGKAWIVTNGDETTPTKLNFSLLIDFFVKEHGYALYAMDLRGHGYSSGERMFVSDWHSQHYQDFANFCRFVSEQEHPGVPFFLMGESYGSNLCLHMAREFQKNRDNDNDTNKDSFCGICVLCPAIVGDVPPAPVVFLLTNILAPMYPSWAPFFMPNPVSPERIWKDPKVFALNTDKRKREMGLDASGKTFCLATATEMLKALKQAREVTIPTLEVPFCVIHGTEDFAIPMEGTDFLERTAVTPESDQSIWRLEGGYHDLLGSIESATPTVEYMHGFMQEQLIKNNNKKMTKTMKE